MIKRVLFWLRHWWQKRTSILYWQDRAYVAERSATRNMLECVALHRLNNELEERIHELEEFVKDFI